VVVSTHADISYFAEPNDKSNQSRHTLLVSDDDDDDYRDRPAGKSGRIRTIKKKLPSAKSEPAKPLQKIYRPRASSSVLDQTLSRDRSTTSGTTEGIAAGGTTRYNPPKTSSSRAQSENQNSWKGQVSSTEELDTLRQTVIDQEEKLVWLIDEHKAQLKVLKEEHQKEIDRLWMVIEKLMEPKES
jgi:hypothetical protein